MADGGKSVQPARDRRRERIAKRRSGSSTVRSCRPWSSLGGEATRKEIEAKLEETLASSLKEGDFVTNAHGVPRWKVMVGRARKHMIAEGFVTGENLLRWKITSKGEQAAKSGVKGR